jgi:predicted DNA-binding transcriptional regulator AlpA
MTTMSLSNTSNDSQQLNGYMRLEDVLRVIPIAKSTWAAGVKRGIYPKPFHPSRGTSAWRTSDIANLIEQISNAQVKK